MSQPIRIAPGRTLTSSIAMALSGLALVAALGLGLEAVVPASAETLRMGAGSPSSGGSAGPSRPARPLFRPAPPTVVSTAPSVVYQPRFFYSAPFNHMSPFNHVPHSYFPYRAPSSFAGAYIAPSYGQWTPGYWAYTWIPQGQATSVWVPGYYDKDSVWVAGYYATQVVQSGYYQPYWVSGYWAP
jgi:hypothetical protein